MIIFLSEMISWIKISIVFIGPNISFNLLWGIITFNSWSISLNGIELKPVNNSSTFLNSLVWISDPILAWPLNKFIFWNWFNDWKPTFKWLWVQRLTYILIWSILGSVALSKTDLGGKFFNILTYALLISAPVVSSPTVGSSI